MRYLRPYKWVVVIGILTVILPVAMELLVPRMLQFVIDNGIREENMDAIVQGSAVMLVGALAGAIATLGQGVCRAVLSQSMAFDMRNDLFRHIQSLSFSSLDQMQTGNLMTRISSDVQLVRGFSSHGLSLTLRALLMIIGSVIMIVLTDWQLSLIMFVCLALAAVVIYSFTRIARPLFTVVQERLSSLNTILQENLAGIQIVKAFVREDYEIERFGNNNEGYMDANIKVGRILTFVMPMMTILTNLGIVALIWYGGVDVIKGRLSLGELVAFNNYLMIGMTPLMLLSGMVTMASRAEASAERILEILDMKPGMPPGKAPYCPDTMQGRLVFDNVSFHYDHHSDDNNGNILDGVSMLVEPGQKIALLGATGSGKSTLINLLPRFYDVCGGSILIDGIDVRQWNPEALRSQIGIVLQQTTLFSGTIRENIAYGRPDVSFEEIVVAAQSAQAHDFIIAMPQGYDGMVEARGANLSGGQKQRVAIARALLISPSILILDDSTSAVDIDTEFKIQDALESRLTSTTTFIVAQRINSVLTVDQIIILEAGRIIDQGTHHELMKTSSVYQEIYRSQFGDENHNE